MEKCEARLCVPVTESIVDDALLEGVAPVCSVEGNDCRLLLIAMRDCDD